jgi:hypothetical protein
MVGGHKECPNETMFLEAGEHHVDVGRPRIVEGEHNGRRPAQNVRPAVAEIA